MIEYYVSGDLSMLTLVKKKTAWLPMFCCCDFVHVVIPGDEMNLMLQQPYSPSLNVDSSQASIHHYRHEMQDIPYQVLLQKVYGSCALCPTYCIITTLR